jgi:hypothetical protein
MKFDDLITFSRDLPFFDVNTLSLVSGDPKGYLSVQLNGWTAKESIIRLRRGYYTLGRRYRRAPLSDVAIANALCSPSYLTGLWALSLYGMIPEMVTAFTSATTRTTCSFENEIGRFEYHKLKPDFFFGYSQRPFGETRAWVAEPEKAVLDALHAWPGEWTTARLGAELRLQPIEAFDTSKLAVYAQRWGSPRLLRAAAAIETLFASALVAMKPL